MERIQPVSAISPAVIDLRDGSSARLRLASYRRRPRAADDRPGSQDNGSQDNGSQDSGSLPWASSSGESGGASRRWGGPDPWAPPGPREIEAARALGLSTEASQAEIDARFRQIVRNQRPDLGQMSPEELAVVLSARRVLRARNRESATAPRPTYGTSTTRAGRFIDLDA